MAGTLKNNLERIQSRITGELKQNANLQAPTIVAVSKKQPIEKIVELHKLGINNFGENYLQEAVAKIVQLKNENIRWHFIGKIQSKKIKDIVTRFDWIHSVSRWSELEKIDELSAELQRFPNCLIQLNIAREESKQGIHPEELEDFVRKTKKLKNIKLKGMMVFPPLVTDEQAALREFEKAYNHFLKAQSILKDEFKHLSMGTSRDYHLALRKGATDLRIGEVLLGAR